MIRLSTADDFRRLKTLTFCYLCDQPFDDEIAKDKDHVPPRACFRKEDRDPPVILPTHRTCNGACNLTDDQMGQLVSLLHGKHPAPRSRHVAFSALPLENSRMGVVAVTNIDLPAAVWRWIRAFHAALYRHPLPADTIKSISLPLQPGRIRSGKASPTAMREQSFLFARMLRQNADADNYDGIVAYRGKLRYRSVWVKANSGEWFCVFGLDLYEWKRLGEQRALQPRICSGYYRPGLPTPPSGSATTCEIDMTNLQQEDLDPFQS